MKTRTIGGIFIKAITGIFIVQCVSIMFCGCNPDAFVSHIGPSSRDFIASEDGDTIKVRFMTDDWSVFTINADGTTLYSFAGSATSTVMADGKIKLSDDKFTMFYIKTDDNELELFFLPNFSLSDHKVTVFVSNSFEEDSLTITQRHGIGYELERMEWNGTVKRTLPEFEKGWGPTSYKNPGPDTLYVPCAVFSNAERKVSFSDDMEFGHFCGDFLVPVPDRALNQGELAFNDKERIKYCYETERYPLDNDSKVVMRFPPTNEFSWYYGMLWYVDAYETDYTMVLRNKGTGKSVKVDGTFTSESPNGEYTFYVDKR